MVPQMIIKDTPQKFIDTKDGHKRSRLFQIIILGIHVSFRGCIPSMKTPQPRLPQKNPGGLPKQKLFLRSHPHTPGRYQKDPSVTNSFCFGISFFMGFGEVWGPIFPRHVSHEKNNLLLSIESWLVNRDPCNGVL